MNRRRISAAAIAAFALLPLSNVSAQENATGVPSPPPAAATSDERDNKPQDPSEAATLPPVIVTAEKSGHSLMNTATSATVLDQHDLENRAGLTTARDVLADTPNVALVGVGNTAPTVRGVDGTGAAQGADAFFAGSRPRLNMQIDGRPESYNEIVFGDSTMWDVDQVEVLLGPQSTLQGRNAIAGTVAIKTNDPTFDNEGALQLGGGNYDQRRASAMISGPILDDTLAYRFAADYLTKTSFVKGYPAFPAVDNPRDFKALNLRGKLLFEPQSVQGLKTLLTLNHSDYSGPQVEQVTRPFSNYYYNSGDMPVFEPKTTSAIADTQYVINSKLNFESLLSGTDLNVKRKAPPGTGIADIDGREYMFEPRLHYTGTGGATSVAGIYLFRTSQNETIDYPGNEAFKDRVTTAAIFGEGTLPVTGVLDVIAGARLEKERHERHGGNINSSDPMPVNINVDNTDNVFLPKLGLAWHVNPKTTLGVLASRGYNGGGGGFVVISDPSDSSKSEITNYEYAAEHVWTYELYGRQQLMHDRLRLTANLFHSTYHDMQLEYDLTPTDPTDYSFIIKNADRVVTYGTEFGATWLVQRGLEVYTNAGLLKARITEYPGSGFQGNRLPNSPVLTLAAGVTWKRNRWDASLNARSSSSYYSDIENNPRGKVGPYWIADTQLGYTISRVRVYGSVKNLFDSDKPLAVYSGATAANDTASILPPRMYWLGVQVSY